MAGGGRRCSCRAPRAARQLPCRRSPSRRKGARDFRVGRGAADRPPCQRRDGRGARRRVRERAARRVFDDGAATRAGATPRRRRRRLRRRTLSGRVGRRQGDAGRAAVWRRLRPGTAPPPSGRLPLGTRRPALPLPRGGRLHGRRPASRRPAGAGRGRADFTSTRPSRGAPRRGRPREIARRQWWLVRWTPAFGPAQVEAGAGSLQCDWSERRPVHGAREGDPRAARSRVDRLGESLVSWGAGHVLVEVLAWARRPAAARATRPGAGLRRPRPARLSALDVAGPLSVLALGG